MRRISESSREVDEVEGKVSERIDYGEVVMFWPKTPAMILGGYVAVGERYNTSA